MNLALFLEKVENPCLWLRVSNSDCFHRPADVKWWLAEVCYNLTQVVCKNVNNIAKLWRTCTHSTRIVVRNTQFDLLALQMAPVRDLRVVCVNWEFSGHLLVTTETTVSKLTEVVTVINASWKVTIQSNLCAKMVCLSCKMYVNWWKIWTKIVMFRYTLAKLSNTTFYESQFFRPSVVTDGQLWRSKWAHLATLSANTSRN